jgi:hypothetical protein
MNIDKERLTTLPVISLIIANLFPLVGVLFWGWDAFYVVLLYWAENIIIGFYTAVKMFTAGAKNHGERILRIFPVAFFTFHYGMFCLVHGVFVFVLFGKDRSYSFPFMIYVGFAILFVSHGIGFMQNYISNGKYRSATFAKLMSEPYPRIIPLHIAIMFGGWLTMAFGSPMGLLIVFVILKTIFEISWQTKKAKN